MNLLITFHPLLKWKQGTSFEEESTDAEFKHIGYKKIALQQYRKGKENTSMRVKFTFHLSNKHLWYYPKSCLQLNIHKHIM